MNKQELMNNIKGKLIVSCQARVGWPMYGPDIMAAFAMAAYQGGAAAIRATGVDNLKAIKDKVDLPLMGINKIFLDGYDVYITPTYESAKQILDVGIDMIGIDATQRKRPNNENVKDILNRIKEEYPDVITIGEIATLEEAEIIKDYGFDFISTTLSGFTKESDNVKSLNLELIKQIRTITDTPVIAEGMIHTPEQAKEALEAGAFCIVVGTAITRPEVLTKNFVDAIKSREPVKKSKANLSIERIEEAYMKCGLPKPCLVEGKGSVVIMPRKDLSDRLNSSNTNEDISTNLTDTQTSESRNNK